MSLESGRKLPPLTKREESAVRLVKSGNTGCSDHLVDLGLLSREEIRPNHEALRRVAKRLGIYNDPNHWLGPLTLLILNDPWLSKG